MLNCGAVERIVDGRVSSDVVRGDLIYMNIQGDSGGICNTLGNESTCDSKQKSSYEHGSDFERLRKIRTISSKSPVKKSRPLYRVIQEEFAILWEMIVCVILSKKVHLNMGPILNGYRYM